MSDIRYHKDAPLATIDGVTIPVRTSGIAPAEIVEQLKNVVGRPYMGLDAKKHGMTLLEAALVSAAEKAADGDLDALQKVLDRLMGKPVQQVISASGSLKDFLDQIAGTDREVVDVTGGSGSPGWNAAVEVVSGDGSAGSVFDE